MEINKKDENKKTEKEKDSNKPKKKGNGLMSIFKALDVSEKNEENNSSDELLNIEDTTEKNEDNLTAQPETKKEFNSNETIFASITVGKDNVDKEILETEKEISSELHHIEEELEKIEAQLLPESNEIKKKKFSFNKKIFASIAIAIVMIIVTGSAAYGLISKDKEEKEAVRAESVQKKAKKVNIGDNLRKNAIKTVKKQEAIPAYSLNQIHKMDMRKPSGVTVADLKLITRQGLVGLEPAFVKAEKKYGVNALFLIGIASMESANGTICFKPNNMFGYGSKGYPSKEANIYDVADGLANNYLKPGASLYNGTKIRDVNKRYASSSTWDDKVANNMHRYYQTISARRKAAIKKLTK